MSDKNFCMSQYASLEDLYKAKAEHYESEYRTLKASQSKVKAEGIREAKSDFFIDMDRHRNFHEVEKDNGEIFKAWFYYEVDIERWFDKFAAQLEKGEL